MGWSPVTTLPAEGDEGGSDDVLAQFADGTMEVAFFDYAEQGWCDRWGHAFAPGSVTHWRPLPDGPKD
jgi:hypothetical protein